MLAFGTWLLLSAASATPTPAMHGEPLASTWDEAACDPSDGGECAVEPTLSLPDLPSILDCNDARLSAWMQEMIGSCDMPKASPLGAHVATVRNAKDQEPSRICDGLCAQRSAPIRSAPRLGDDLPPLAISTTALAGPPPLSGSLHNRHRARPSDAPGSRLERPPRRR